MSESRMLVICPLIASRPQCTVQTTIRYPQDWRALMEKTRDAAKQLVKDGKLEILKKGSVIDPSEIKGPIRLRLKVQ